MVYEYLKQFTNDPGVQDTLTFLMTREVAHYQQFTAALNELPVNLPPGQLPGDPRFQNVAPGWCVVRCVPGGADDGERRDSYVG